MSEEKEENDEKRLNQRIADVFGLEHPPAINLPATTPQNTNNQSVIVSEEREDLEMETDFQAARQTLLDLSQKGQQALENFMVVAQESESPRAYEVLAKLLDTTAASAKDLVQLHKAKKEIKHQGTKEDPTLPGPAMNINNANIIVGTTADMLKKIQSPSEE